jgi:hypothetical protein
MFIGSGDPAGTAAFGAAAICGWPFHERLKSSGYRRILAA